MLLRIDVRFYDKEQENAFVYWPSKQNIDSLVANGLNVDELELLTYSVFSEQRSTSGWRTYADMRKLLTYREEMFRQYFDLSQGTVTSRFAADDSETSMTEKVGVATSLMAANKIFSLHEADWTRIPKGQVKTLDFFYASTGSAYIEIESKGSVVADVSLKGSSISKHKAGILAKKAVQRKRPAPPHVTYMMGSIASVSNDSSQRAVCWLVDPPGEEPALDPKKFKLLTRLEFYMKELRPLLQSSLLIALRNRIEAIFMVSDYERLDGVALVGNSGEPFRLRGPFLRNKTVIILSRGKVLGRVFYLSERRFMFVGFDVDVYRLIARQRFQDILDYQSRFSSDESIIHRIEAWLEPGDFANENPVGLGAEWVEKKKRFRLILEGPVLFTQSGRAVGALTPIGDRNAYLEPHAPQIENESKTSMQLAQGEILESLRALRGLVPA